MRSEVPVLRRVLDEGTGRARGVLTACRPKLEFAEAASSLPAALDMGQKWQNGCGQG